MPPEHGTRTGLMLDAGHASRLLTRLERDAFPALGSRGLRSVTSGDVLAMVRSVEARGALDVSRRLKQHVSQIYRFAIPQGWADQDPAAYLSGLLKPKPRTRHMARVGLSELPALVRSIDRYDGEETPRRRAVTRAALLFTLLTWARTNETRLATWDESEDLDGAEPLWRVPSSRMKMEREHLVPLAPQVVALLAGVRAYSTGGCFWRRKGRRAHLPEHHDLRLLSHGLSRPTDRARFPWLAFTWANEAECYRSEWIEMGSHTPIAMMSAALTTAHFI